MVAKEEKPTVLIVENSVDTTGAFNTIFSYAQYAKSSYRFVFILPEKSRLLDKVRQSGFSVETLPFREINKNPVNLLLYVPVLIANAFRLKKTVRHHRARIVHVNDFYNLVGTVAKLLGGRFALLTHVRFMPNRFPRPLVWFWMKFNLAYSEYIICVSQAVKDCLTEHPKLRVIYDGLAREDMLKFAAARGLTVPTADPSLLQSIARPPSLPNASVPETVDRKESASEIIRLLYLAHYIPGKGQDIALEVFGRAYRQNPALRLRFVGGDMGLTKNQQYRTQLVSHAQELDVAYAITFDSPTTQVSEALAQADIALNFSESESFSMTCLEALAQGVPLIVTDCGGPAELFEHGKSGYLIPNRDVEAGKEAILRLASDREMRQRFSQNSTHYVRRKFSAENTFKKLADVYAKALPC